MCFEGVKRVLFLSLIPSQAADLNVLEIPTVRVDTSVKTRGVLRNLIPVTHHLVVQEQHAWSTTLETQFAGKKAPIFLSDSSCQCSVFSGRCEPGLVPKPDTITGCGPECVRDPDCARGYVCEDQRCIEKPDPCDPSPCGPVPCAWRTSLATPSVGVLES